MNGIQKSEDVQAFVAVVRHGSLILAAETLEISQPAVTRRIQSLEEALGVELLERHTKPLKPSIAGLQIYDQCRVILREMQVLQGMLLPNAQPTGVLRLGAPFIINGAPLVRSIVQLKKGYPQLRVQLSPGWSSTLINRVENGELDVALAVQPATSVLPPSVAGEILADLNMVVVAPRGEFPKSRYRLRDIYSRGWVLNPRECGMRSSLEAALTAQGFPLSLNVDLLGTEMQLGLIASGAGLGLVPERLLATSSFLNEVQQLDVTDFSLQNKIWLVRPVMQGNLGAAAQAIGELVKNEFR